MYKGSEYVDTLINKLNELVGYSSKHEGLARAICVVEMARMLQDHKENLEEEYKNWQERENELIMQIVKLKGETTTNESQ